MTFLDKNNLINRQIKILELIDSCKFDLDIIANCDKLLLTLLTQEGIKSFEKIFTVYDLTRFLESIKVFITCSYGKLNDGFFVDVYNKKEDKISFGFGVKFPGKLTSHLDAMIFTIKLISQNIINNNEINKIIAHNYKE